MNVRSIFKAMSLAILCLGALGLASCGDDNDDPTPSEEMKLSATKVKIAPEEAVRINATNCTEPLTAVTGNEKVATATVNGKTITVLGVAEGATTVTVTDQGHKTALITVTIKNHTAMGITFDRDAVTVGVGKDAIIYIRTGSMPFSVVSSDNTVATATVKDSKITVKGIKAGTATLTVTDNEKKTGTILVTVK